MLNAFVRAMHPIAPFVTEEIWLTLPHDGATIVTASWPDVAEMPAFAAEAETFRAVIEKVEQLRNARAEWAHRAQGRRCGSRFPPRSPARPAWSKRSRRWRAPRSRRTTAATARCATRIARRIRAVADTAKLRERYTREVARLGVRGRALGEEARQREFRRASASADVVAAERAKLDEYRRELQRNRDALAALA